MQGINRNNINNLTLDVCRIRDAAENYEFDDINPYLTIDTTAIEEDSEIIRLKTSLNDSVGKVAGEVTQTISSILETNQTSSFSQSLQALIGKVLAHNSITHDPIELNLQVTNILDRIFRLPIDKHMSNLHHYRSKSYRNTAQIDPNLCTLVKALIIAPVVDVACNEDNKTEGIIQLEDASEATAHFKLNAEQAQLKTSQELECYDVMRSMPEISIPYLSRRLLNDHENQATKRNIMDVLASMDLAYNAELERFLINTILTDGAKLLRESLDISEELKSDHYQTIHYELSTLARFERLNYNSDLEELLGKILSQNSLDPDIHSYALEILSKMDYSNHTIGERAKAQLLERATSLDYSNEPFYATIALLHSIQSITKNDLDQLLDAIGTAATDRLLIALIIKIGQSKEGFKSRILANIWSQIESDKLEFDVNQHNAFEIIENLSRDRIDIDNFINGRPLDEHDTNVLPLALSVYEYLTRRDGLERDQDIETIKDDVYQQIGYKDLTSRHPNAATIISCHKLAGDYGRLIDDLVIGDVVTRQFAAHQLRAYMYEPKVINKLKDIALESEDENLKINVMSLMGFAASSFNQCLEQDAHQEIDAEEDAVFDNNEFSFVYEQDGIKDDEPTTSGYGNDTALKLMLGNPQEKIKTQALNAILEIVNADLSPKISAYAHGVALFLGANAYEEISKTIDQDPALNNVASRVAEQIMLNSRYLRARQYSVGV